MNKDCFLTFEGLMFEIIEGIEIIETFDDVDNLEVIAFY